jgi:hypothetical protein
LRDLGGAVFRRVDEKDLGVGRDAADVVDDFRHGTLLVHGDHGDGQFHRFASKIIWNASIPGQSDAMARSIGWAVFR